MAATQSACDFLRACSIAIGRVTQGITHLQVESMQLIPGVEVAAVAAGSSKEKAEGFAKEHGESQEGIPPSMADILGLRRK